MLALPPTATQMIQSDGIDMRGKAAASSGPAALTINQEVGSFELSKAGIKPGSFCVLMQPGKCLCTQEARKGHGEMKCAVAVHACPFAFQNQCPGSREVLPPPRQLCPVGTGPCLWPLNSMLLRSLMLQRSCTGC